jgi:UDP-glucose 4-epimerase
MNILVTGGAGFIGSHVVDALIERGHSVSVIDNLSSGKKEYVHSQSRLHEGDITDYAFVKGVLDAEQPEVIYHLAAQIEVRTSVHEPLFDAENNILASLNLIHEAHKRGIQKFVFSSTGGAIYGDTEERPTPETHPEWPLSPYGIAKLSVDKYLNYYQKMFGFPFVSLRYSNIFGPRQNPHGEAGVVAMFLNKMLKDEQPIINGDGKQTRDYLYVADVVSANMAVLDHMDVSGIFNIGTGTERDVILLFKELNKHFDGQFAQEHGPAKQGEQRTSALDASAAQKQLGWQPTVSFEDGIARTYEWFVKQSV